jgi:hypothetical protein
MGTTWVPLSRRYYFGYQTGREQPQKRAFGTPILPNLRELERFFATRNPKVAGSNPIESAGPGGAVRFVRRELDVQAFGINWSEIPPDAEGHEHDESGSGPERCRSWSAAQVTGESTVKKCGSTSAASSALTRRRAGVRWRAPKA